MTTKPFLTVIEAADFLGVSPMTVYRLAKRAALPAEKVGRCWRFSVEQLKEWMKRQRPTLEQDPAYQKFLELGRVATRRSTKGVSVNAFLEFRNRR